MGGLWNEIVNLPYGRLLGQVGVGYPQGVKWLSLTGPSDTLIDPLNSHEIRPWFEVFVVEETVLLSRALKANSKIRQMSESNSSECL
jgi:hypothetical protein